MAGFAKKHGLWVLVLCALSQLGSSQSAPKSTAKHSVETSTKPVAGTSSHLLTSDEGLAIIGAALQTRNGAQHSNGDCSHLVHSVYEQAGFPYIYADSSQLYDGIEDFRQVAHPQPGDLAVWRGHAAIVVNPAQHSFFSATRSELRVESYDLEYWQRRGPPRFFRYVKPRSLSSTSVTRTATAKLPALRNVESRTPAAVASSDGQSTNGPLPPPPPAVSTLPRILVVHARQPKPKEVNRTLSQSFSETDKALRGQDVTKLSQPLIVFDHVEVKGVHLNGNQGWADVKIDGVSSIVDGRATPKKRSEQQRWVLTRRDGNTWELLLPMKTTYLPHDLAIRILAHQLASLADQTSEAGDSSKDQAQLARTLNLLLKK